MDGQEVFTSASIGIAVCPFDGEDADALLKHADTAMYWAKARGRNNYQFFSKSMNEAAKTLSKEGLAPTKQDFETALDKVATPEKKSPTRRPKKS